MLIYFEIAVEKSGKETDGDRMGKAPSLKEKIHAAVLQDIIQGGYKPSDIISEKQLIEKYGVSKSPVRDALIELCNENILRSIPRFGYEIVRLTEQDVRNIVEFRVMVESECLRKSMRLMNDQDMDEIAAYTLANCRRSDQADIWEHWENNIRFHLHLVQYCGNEYCYRTIQTSVNTLLRAYAQFHWERWKRTSFVMGCEGHMRVVDAVRAREPEKAVALLVEDIRSLEEIF